MAIQSQTDLTPLIKAAEYVRMSTDQQVNSISYQQAAIRLYAVQRGMSIVRTYADEGRSGLTLQDRPAMVQLLADIETGLADFDVILVYDVSRWGRYQDTDEGAFYEFKCRKAGKEVQYCAEQFVNDAGPMATVLKAIKRAMAAEYSRELSVKTSAAKSRLAAQGFLPGGAPGYGFRRMVVDLSGREKGMLPDGELKGSRTDRIRVVPGPPEELAIVRRIFKLFVVDHMFIQRIADLLNREGVLYAKGKYWTHQAIRRILTDEKYIGTIVSHRTASYLRLGERSSGRTRTDPSKWIRGATGFQPIVSPELFAAANLPPPRPNLKYRNDAALLDPIRALLEKHGYLNARLINVTKDIPGPAVLRRRFGGLREVYAKLDYVPARRIPADIGWPATHSVIAQIVPEIVEEARKQGISTVWKGRNRLLIFDTGMQATVGIARYLSTRHETSPHWVLHTKHRIRPDATFVVRLDPPNMTPEAYYVLPATVLSYEHTYFDRSGRLEGYRCQSFEVALRTLLNQAVCFKKTV